VDINGERAVKLIKLKPQQRDRLEQFTLVVIKRKRNNICQKVERMIVLNGNRKNQRKINLNKDI